MQHPRCSCTCQTHSSSQSGHLCMSPALLRPVTSPALPLGCSSGGPPLWRPSWTSDASFLSDPQYFISPFPTYRDFVGAYRTAARFVCSGCCNLMPHMGWLKQRTFVDQQWPGQTMDIPTVLEAEAPDAGALDLVSGAGSLRGLQMVPPPCVLTQHLLGVWCRERNISGVSSSC